jgi:succinate dehydrogenase / fumarate reductase membrane anchor subunit
MWAWLLHRLTGVGIFVFLLIHIVDTALIGWGRDLYDAMMQLYHHPVFRIGEILLFGAVLFHGLNGLRVIVLDFVPITTVYQRQMLIGVAVVFFVTFIPAALVMFGQMLQGGSRHVSWDNALTEWKAWLPTLSAAFAIFSVYAPTVNLPRLQASVRPVGGLELYGWLFIRISGVLLIFLVLGHLVIMHLLDGGVNRVNYDFVAQRLSTPFWRTYDFALLVLAMGHGVWGMRNVLLDYIHRPIARLVALSLLYTVAGVVLALGAIVLFTFQPR